VSATQAPPAAESVAPEAGPARGRAWTWVAVAAVSLAAFVVLTWPLTLHMDRIWTAYPTPDPGSNEAASYQPDQLLTGDNLQNVFIQSVVVDNLRALRSPYLDLREGAAGPTPLKTTSLDLPWTLLLALLWPVTGLQAAYNAGLLLSSVATGVAAFAWLRRHTRWPLLATAGALAYAYTPHRMFQLTGHFNAVMWWAFPAALVAFEAMMERHRAGRPWRWPAAGLAAITLTVAVGGEYHLILYLTGLLSYLVIWTLVAALARRRGVPWGPLATVVVTLGVACGYVLGAFHAVFQGSVAGENGSWQQVALYSPASLWALVRKSFGTQGEGLIYVGLPLLVLAALGLVAVLVRRRAALVYAVLAVPLVVLTYGARADVAGIPLYRFLFDHLPFLSFQRVPERLMVVTALILVLLAVTTLDVAGELLAGRRRALVAAGVVLCLATVAMLADYRVSRNRLEPDRADNRVVAALRTAGDGAGPVLGIPIMAPSVTWNSSSTYIGAQSRRRTLNAYNQTPAPWQAERVARLDPLNRGQADPAALEVLRQTGTRQVVVIDEPRVFAPGEWQATVDRLLASGQFRLVTRDGPLALLELTT
jgi:MFS family permease